MAEEDELRIREMNSSIVRPTHQEE